VVEGAKGVEDPHLTLLMGLNALLHFIILFCTVDLSYHFHKFMLSPLKCYFSTVKFALF
jgi:hypothetical protein